MSREAGARGGANERPGSVNEALEAAWSHGRASAAEALRAVASLADAARLAAGSGASDSRLTALLDAAATAAERGGAEAGGRVLESVAEALDAQIGRWEHRAADDPDARAVLRAFLGLRELLWEFGVRPGRRPGRSRSRPATPREAPPRVQRVPVEG